MPVVEWSLNVGTVAALLFAIDGFYWVTKSDMKVMKENVVAIKSDLKVLTEVMRDLAVQKNAIENHSSMIVTQAGQIKTLEDRFVRPVEGQGIHSEGNRRGVPELGWSVAWARAPRRWFKERSSAAHFSWRP